MSIKRLIILIAIFLFTAVLSFSQEIAYQKTIEFNRQRLTVEVYKQRYGFLSISNIGGINIGSAALSEIKKWKAYRGFTEISEPEFFKTAGYKEEAEQCNKYYENLKLKEQNSLVGMAVSGLGMVVGTALMTFSNANFFIITGGVLSISGTIGFSISAVIFRAVTNAKNWAPASLAVVVAEDYNRDLRRRVGFE